MKFLVENYASFQDTQALYLAKYLNKDGHDAFLWNKNTSSLYDVFDENNPEYYITQVQILSKDFAHYFNNVNSNLKLLLNVSGLNQTQIYEVETLILNSGLNCPFFFDCRKDIKTKKIRYVNINHAYDESIMKQNKLVDYNIETAIVVDKVDQITTCDGSYHIVSTNKELANIVDIVLPELHLSRLYGNYETVIFKNIEDYVPQSFFDSIFYGNKTYYSSSNPQVDEMINKMLKIESSLNVLHDNKLDDFSELKSYVEKKHGGQNRTKTLLSQLPQ